MNYPGVLFRNLVGYMPRVSDALVADVVRGVLDRNPALVRLYLARRVAFASLVHEVIRYRSITRPRALRAIKAELAVRYPALF